MSIISGEGAHPKSTVMQPRPPSSPQPTKKERISGAWRTTVAQTAILRDKASGITLGRLTRWLLVAMVALLPALHSWGYAASFWYLIAWFFLFILREGVNKYDEGKKRETTAINLSRINNSVSGTIDSVTREMLKNDSRCLGEPETKKLTSSLLHRIHDYADYVLRCPPEVRLRVTLAVPWHGPKDADPLSLRAWCYDQPHADRRWTTLPLPNGPGEEPLPGSPRAFVTRKLQIIDDIHAIEQGGHAFRDRAFRSVLSIPVQSGGPDGDVLAVVNLDSTQPSFFKSAQVQSALLPLVGPSINLLALVLLIRSKEARYEFLS